MTEPQRHKMVAGGAVAVAACLILYLIVFGFHSFDPRSLLLFVGFFAVAAKLSTVKHKHNPMI
jgi:membrane-bound ClpP family serine protease